MGRETRLPTGRRWETYKKYRYDAMLVTNRLTVKKEEDGGELCGRIVPEKVNTIRATFYIDVHVDIILMRHRKPNGPSPVLIAYRAYPA